jgi:hypothetical protein
MRQRQARRIAIEICCLEKPVATRIESRKYHSTSVVKVESFVDRLESVEERTTVGYLSKLAS